jgi:hypothetical protein
MVARNEPFKGQEGTHDEMCIFILGLMGESCEAFKTS